MLLLLLPFLYWSMETSLLAYICAESHTVLHVIGKVGGEIDRYKRKEKYFLGFLFL